MNSVVFDNATIASKFADFYRIAEAFCDAMNATQDRKIRIDSHLLYLAVVATYDDIARYKIYHLTDPAKQRSNSVKRAAFATKWIVRFSPLVPVELQDAHETTPGLDDYVLENALFALNFSFLHMAHETGRDFDIDPEKIHELTYDLIFRDISSDALILAYQMIFDLAQGKNFLR
jgi:hypothetical protein